MLRQPSDLTDAALTYATQGRPVIPLRSHGKQYTRNGWSVFPVLPRGKKPLTPNGVKDTTTDADTIRQWAERWPGANIGLAVPPGFLVLDTDSADALNRIRAKDLVLPATSRATTGRLLPRVDVRAPSNPTGLSAEEWHRKIRERVTRGRRNQTLAQVAGLLFRKLPADVAAEFAYCWAQVRMDPPLPDREIMRTLDSIASRELRRRGRPA